MFEESTDFLKSFQNCTRKTECAAAEVGCQAQYRAETESKKAISIEDLLGQIARMTFERITSSDKRN